jgi:peptidoglycan/LPS O-acetylase OafA/YrhL
VKRFVFIDGLRGIAALSVALYHAVEGDHITSLLAAMPSALQTVLHNGNNGVALFFVISGFVIAHSLRDDITLSEAGRFMLRRSIRLDPPYWFAIALTCLIAAAKGTAAFAGAQIAAHLFYAQDLLGFPSISPIFWTLCLEIQFYVVFAALLLTRSRGALIAAFVASVPLSCFVLVPGLFTSLWYGFLLGAAAYISWKAERPVWFLTYAAVMFGLGLYRADVFMLVCVVSAFALFAVARIGRLTTFLNWRALQFIGSISYSLYLLHNPVIGATFRIGYWLTERTMITEALWWAVSILACVGAAFCLWFAIERPSMNLAKSVMVANM